ncbi:hypothetical protein RHMOL_Rhmol13G0222100 [Rhododendron molle]|uniref:Uncharacterized protein n=1 Tax=Rhododendron molle TaxID=49168 RepID=A0ACC0LAD2_RHOML|nr:hypothetical protein RHMOL_Rhmol13G0222100 [Rhododendron molle]
MDLLLLGSDQKEVDHIEDLLRQANAEQVKDLVGVDWLAKKRNPLMVVAGESVRAYHHKSSYPYFLWFNTIRFVASLSTILLLISGLGFKNKAAMWFLMVTLWLAITAIATTYAFATFVVTPKTDHRSLGYTIKIGVIVWSGLMSILLLNHTFNLVTIFVKEKRSKMKAIRRIMGFNPQSLLGGLPIVYMQSPTWDRWKSDSSPFRH